MTDNLSEANYFAKKLKAGTVYVNCYNYLTQTAPFGGVKDSGLGRDLAEEGLNSYLETKTVIENLD